MSEAAPSTSLHSGTKIAAAMALAQGEMRAVVKSGRNEYDKYDYAKLDDYVDVVRPVLAKHSLSLIFPIDEITQLEGRPTQKGGVERAVRVKCRLIIIHASGESIELSAWGEGQDRADKAIYKAVTGARKYALAAAFNLSTGDDPEKFDGDAGRASSNVAAKPELSEAAQAFVLAFETAMGVRGLADGGKSQRILFEALKKKKVGVEKLTEEQRTKILSGVEAGEWDKYFKRQIPQT